MTLVLVDIQKECDPKRIKVLKIRSHKKASERYIDVVFIYEGSKWEGSVPIEYRRTNVDAKTPKEIAVVLNATYENMNPSKAKEWIRVEDAAWAERKADVTRSFYNALKNSKWMCQKHELPQNPNFARRVQDLKEMGYTIATDRKYCDYCGQSTTHLIMLKNPRVVQTGYETITPQMQKRICEVLKNFDVYENSSRLHVLPDHKFPETRWDEKTRETNDITMSDEEIRAKFQLLNNQRNEQKREVCRNCFQSGHRGYPFGIRFFYQGDSEWPKNVPTRGKEAEKGCCGCGWYDLAKWRFELNRRIDIGSRSST